MGNEIQARTTKAPAIRWSEPSVAVELVEPLRKALSQPFAYLPVLDDRDVADIPALIEQYRAGLAPSSDDQIERMMTKIALLYPGAKLSDAEMDARLELYAELLRDIPFDLLSQAFRSVAQTSRFFPSVAEIREAATAGIAERRGKVLALLMLQRKHEQEWSPPIAQEDRVAPGDTARILAEFGIGQGDARAPSQPAVTSARRAQTEPTIKDCTDRGLTEDEAKQAMEDHRRLLSRGKPKQIGDLATDALDQARAA